MYPWPDPFGDFGGPFYPPEDLPDTVVVPNLGDEVLTHVVGEYKFLNAVSGHFIEAGPDGQWTSPQTSNPSDCLIGEWATNFVVEDQFMDTYNADIAGVSQTVTRTTPGGCTWYGEKIVGDEFPALRKITLKYGEVDAYKWQATVQYDDNPPDTFYKDDPQSSPDGSYAGVVIVT